MSLYTEQACAANLRDKRVLILFPHMVLQGGALNYMLKLVELLVESGAKVGILAMQVDQQKYASLKGVELLSINGPVTSKLGYWAFFPFWQARIDRTIRAWRPDVLVPQVFPANWWGWLYKRKNQRPAIVWVCQEPSAFIHSRNWMDALQPVWKKYLARALSPLLAFVDIRLSRYSDKIVGNSLYTAGTIEKIYQRKADAIAYPAIDFREFHPEEDVIKEEAIVTVAKLTKFKRVDFLLRVFSLVQKRYPRLVYHIVGRGEEEGALKALAAELQITANVQFHRDLNNAQLADLHRRSMLFLHGSIEEPFGMAPLEAIACGTPVIAHRSGGPLEYVNESSGRLIDSLSAERWGVEINDFIGMLAENPAYFRAVSENARNFSWEVTLSPLINLIAAHCD